MESKDFHIEDANQIDMVVHHVFLTRRLPHKEDKESLSGTLVRFTFNYLPNVTESDGVSGGLLKMGMPAEMPGLNSVRKTMEIWKNIQSSSVNEIQVKEAIASLHPGQTFAVFVRAHNSVITIRRSEHDTNALMSVFRVSPNNERVSSNNESLLPEGDLFQTFPERAVWIPFDRFISDAFSRQVAMLCNHTLGETLTTATKAGVQYPDYFDVAEPMFVISWLLGAMSGIKQGDDNFKLVQKVIRHEVFYAGGLSNPWRRSGEWLAIKCVLQIMLVVELGEYEGTVVYKSLMIHVISSFLESLPITFDDNDIIMQMLSKISRRMAKLKNYINIRGLGKNSINNMELYNQTIKWTESVFKNGRSVLQKKRAEADNRWNKHSENCSKNLKVSISELRPLDHIIHKFNESTVSRINQAFKVDKNPKTNVENPQCINRWNNETSLFDIKFLIKTSQNNQTEIQLYDFEVWVRMVLWKDFALNTTQFLEDSSQLFDLFFKYLEISVKLYAYDPIGLSRMCLTLFLITAALDSIAIQKEPLLAEYHSSFEEKYFNRLLTPLFEDLKYLHSARNYFAERNKKAIYSSIISNELNMDSLGPRLANENEEMQQKRKDILLYAEKQREEKKREFENSLDEYIELMNEYRRRRHYRDCWGSGISCFKCQAKKKADSIEVYVYEDPIPEDIWRQNAIVFELSIPVSIRCLRDALYFIHKRLNEKQFSQFFLIKQLWKSHPQLGAWVSSECSKSLISIGSDASLISFSRFKIHQINAGSEVEDVLKPCGLTIKLFIKYKSYKNKSIHCKLVECNKMKNKFCTMRAWKEPYAINEKWIAETTHTENEVLASQVNCPLNLELDEYKTFGSLRAGHCLQLRKILKAIEMRSLRFESSSVFAIFAQALWQVGPAIKKDNITKKDDIDNPVLFFESHADLQNDGFCHMFIEYLTKFLENISKNWKKHSQLHIVIIITLRIFSLSSEETRFKAAKLLLKCRSIAETWAIEIESLLSKMMTDSLNEIQEKRFKLIEVAAFSALTFDVDRCYEYVINKETLISWLHAVARIHDNIFLGNDCFDKEKINLLRRVRQIGLRFENVIISILALENTYVFNTFLTRYWADFCNGVCMNHWVAYPQPSQEWYSNTFISNNSSVTLHISILSGKFLVDGNPVGRLPDAITKSPEYQRIFDKHVFDVQPSAEQMSAFVSVHSIQGSRFLFSFRKQECVIVERRSSGDEYELIPFTVFNGHFPNLLVNKYSHWICKKKKVIYFRPVKFDDDNFFKAESEEHFPYQFNVLKNTLYDLQRKRYLVDINSNTFKEIYSCLNRLELREYVHLWVVKKYDKLHQEQELKKQSQSQKEQRKKKKIELEQSQIDDEQYQTKPKKMKIDEEQYQTEQEIMQLDEKQCEIEPKKMQIDDDQLQIEQIEIKTRPEEFALNTELPRMDLTFKVEIKTGKLLSYEYMGLIVADVQGNIETLIGLENSLLLCEDKPLINSQQRVIIVPHSKTIELDVISNHQNVRIKLNELVSPPFFSYNIDDRLRELRGPANQEAWLYLSLLHAMTSSSLPDPFTGLTGTESSMRLLQIGRTFSCKPLDQTAMHTLKSISKLAPCRKQNNVYSQRLQSVTWLPNLHSTYGYESLVLASNILLYHADTYKELFPTTQQLANQQEIKQQETTSIKLNPLTKRAYWRYRTQLNSCAYLHSENEKLIGGFPIRKLAWSYTNDRQSNNASRLIMENFYQWNGVTFIPSNLWELIKTKNSLNNPQEFPTSSMFTLEKFDILTYSLQINLYSYLKLYDLAQKVHKDHVDYFEFSFLLSFLAFKGENVDLLFSLLAVAILQIQVEHPSVKDYEYLNQTDFDLEEIHKVIRKEIRKENIKSIKKVDKTKYKNLKKNAVIALGNIARNQWETKSVDFHSICYTKISDTDHIQNNMSPTLMSLRDIINIDAAEKEVKKLFLRWDSNNKLKSFLNEVESQIRVKNSFHQLDNVTLLNIMNASLLSNPRITDPCSSNAYEIKLEIKNLKESEDAINLFRKKNSVPALYTKTCCDTVNRKNQSEEVLSLLKTLPLLQTDNHDINDDILKFMISSLENSCNNFNKSDLLSLNEIENNQIFNQCIINECQSCLSNLKSESFWKEVEDCMIPQNNDNVDYALLYGGIWRRITPVTIIPCILPLTSLSCALLAIDAKYVVPQSVINRVGALIVSWTAEQRAVRCLKLKLNNKTSPAALIQEVINVGHDNWIPSSYPQWLILELEGNFLIRPIQIDVANSMINANKNFVQQLNMGEGKTSVIVPLLAVSLAKSEQVVRVNVLRSLLNTNFELLVDKLGGLLNRRVYVVPCRRDMNLNPLKILRVYKDCLFGRGLMLTTPEYRLSLNLKTLEHCRKKSVEAVNFYQLRCWLQKHICDVLDEADEILNVKYQVVYTLGDQLLVDGGALRWVIPQAVLKLVNQFGEQIFQKYGEDYIERYVEQSRYDSFSHIRFLTNNQEMYKYMCSLIVDSILNNEVPEVSVAAKLNQNDKEFAKLFITSNNISDTKMNERLSYLFIQNKVLKEELLILRGILIFEVLHMALQKRWRVNFGVSLLNTSSQMAVPFRAKDVASERTEFGHPDMAILLTQISYYMSGLSESQLDDVFIHLDKCTNKEVEYGQWIKAIGIANVPNSLHELNGVNLDSIEQKEELYSLLRYSMSVVNFWLNRVVYPREAKQFPFKITTSAWDLCLKNQFEPGPKNYTTGFSGTNESQLLFPLNIIQNDLPEILETNAMVLSFLLQPENKTYYHINSCVETLEECILKKLVETKACVLIDVGALMLKLDNKKVAWKWLNISSASAAVYFDTEDRLMVCDRKGRTSLLTVSPYLHKLNKCVIYLDDIHTRGTDLKFPMKAIACVTLGKGLTKDRLVQACMRMRLLGKGHSVYFCAPKDVHISIVNQMELRDIVPEAVDILRWAIINSCNTIRDGLLQWSSQGIRYGIKEAVEYSMFKNSIDENSTLDKVTLDSIEELGNKCSEKEVTSLNKFYGGSRSLECVPKIVQSSLDKRVKMFHEKNEATVAVEKLTTIGSNIISRCNKFVSKYKRFANILDEEQERELEAELEEERQVERPGPQTPHIPKLSKEVRDLVKTGIINHENAEILPIYKVFQNTNRMSKLMPICGWSPNIMVTNEFTMVIEDIESGDDFLSEISWVIAVKNHLNHPTYVLISSFEANELLPIFRSIQEYCGVRLHMFAPRLRRGQCILINKSYLSLPDSEGELLDDCLNAQFFVLGGSLFFLTKQEENAYSNFVVSYPLQLEIPNFVESAIEILRTRGRYMHSTSSDVCQLLIHGTRSSSFL